MLSGISNSEFQFDRYFISIDLMFDFSHNFFLFKFGKSFKHLFANLFSKRFYQKAENLISWLYQLTDKNTGGVPNLGSNDGALFFDLSNISYRDFRYTLQRSSIIFRKENIYPLSEICDKSIEILDTRKLKSSTLEQSSFHFKKVALLA